MPWTKLADAPVSLRGAGLTLDLANAWGRFFDRFRDAGADRGDAATRAWLAFKRGHKKIGGRWVTKKSRTMETIGLIFLESTEVQNPWQLTPDQYAPRRSLGNTVFHIRRQLGESTEVWAIYEGRILWQDENGYYLSNYTGSGQSLRLTEADSIPVEPETARKLCRELGAHEQGRHTAPLVEAGRRNSARDEDRLSKVLSLGMDLLGDEKVATMVKDRKRLGRKSAVPATDFGGRKVKKPARNETKSSLRTASRSKRSAAIGYTPLAEKGRVTDGMSDGDSAHPFPHDLQNEPLTVEGATREAITALTGTPLEGVEVDENQLATIQDPLWELSQELDMIGTVQVIIDKPHTLRVLKRAIEAVESARIIKTVPNALSPRGFDQKTLSPETFYTYNLQALADKLEGTPQDWLRIPQDDVDEIHRQAENIRNWLRWNQYPAGHPNQLQTEGAVDVFADIADLYAAAITEIGIADFRLLRGTYSDVHEFHKILVESCGAVEEAMNNFGGKKAKPFKKKGAVVEGGKARRQQFGKKGPKGSFIDRNEVVAAARKSFEEAKRKQRKTYVAGG